MTRPGITTMVLVTAALGFFLAGGSGAALSARSTPATPSNWRLLLCTLAGTALVASAASVLNQVWERESDGRMRRTARRPLPAGRLDPDLALAFGIVLAIAGLALLAATTNLLTALLGAAALAGYVFVYTPLKKVSSLATVVGALPGAIPPMMGWSAVRGEIDLAAWALFGILFFWQMPHFLAIAWLCREDYAGGGFPMLPVLDPGVPERPGTGENGESGGQLTGQQTILYGAALVPVSLLPSLLGLMGPVYFVAALAAGLGYLAFCFGFARRRSTATARRLMFASLLYLPAALGAMLLDRLAAGWLR